MFPMTTKGIFERTVLGDHNVSSTSLILITQSETTTLAALSADAHTLQL